MLGSDSTIGVASVNDLRLAVVVIDKAFVEDDASTVVLGTLVDGMA